MRALGKSVVLGLDIQEKQGTILVPDTHQTSTDRCEVRHIGPLVKNVQKGDIVQKPELIIVATRRGQDYDLMDGDVKCMVVEEDDIRVVLEDNDMRTVLERRAKESGHGLTLSSQSE